MRRRSKLTALEIITKSNVPNPLLWGWGNAEPFLVSVHVLVCMCGYLCAHSCLFTWSELSLLPFTILSKLRFSTVNTWTQIQTRSHTSHSASGKTHHYSPWATIVVNHACPLHQNLPTEPVQGLDIINVPAKSCLPEPSFCPAYFFPLCYVLHILGRLLSG